MDPVRAIADAVLYEGYVLWPYRRSALKNQKRWTFGGVYPPSHSERHPDDRCRVRAECLLEGGGDIDVTARFLHIVRRTPARRTPDGLELVDALESGGERHLAWDEAVEREVGPGRISIAGGEQLEQLDEGVIVRCWDGLEGSVEMTREELGAVSRVRVDVVNSTRWDGGSREDVQRRTFCSAHVVLRAHGGAFISQADPPERFRQAAHACRSEGLWPVLVGEPGSRETVLASPFILEDHPRIAPESLGDFFDGGEIDQMLVLNILSLTDEEKAEMRGSDPRAREILERTEAASEEEIMRLHGAIREFGLTRRP